MERIHIIGAGGIGCAVGYALRAAEVPVTFVEIDAAKLDWGRRHGVAVDRQPPQPADFVLFEEWRADPASVVLLCTKCYDNAAVLQRLPASCRLIPIQNGFDPQLDALGHAEEGIASFVSECLPGQTHTRITRGGKLHLGGRGGPPGTVVQQIAACLKGCPFLQVEVVADILPFKYAKLMYNAAISPIAAAAGLDNGQLLSVPRARRLFFELLRENYAILHAAGIPLARIGPFHPDTVQRILRVPGLARLLAWAFYPSLRGSYCSMSGDIVTGRTEIDYYNGHLIQLARPALSDQSAGLRRGQTHGAGAADAARRGAGGTRGVRRLIISDSTCAAATPVIASPGGRSSYSTLGRARLLPSREPGSRWLFAARQEPRPPNISIFLYAVPLRSEQARLPAKIACARRPALAFLFQLGHHGSGPLGGGDGEWSEAAGCATLTAGPVDHGRQPAHRQAASRSLRARRRSRFRDPGATPWSAGARRLPPGAATTTPTPTTRFRPPSWSCRARPGAWAGTVAIGAWLYQVAYRVALKMRAPGPPATTTTRPRRLTTQLVSEMTAGRAAAGIGRRAATAAGALPRSAAALLPARQDAGRGGPRAGLVRRRCAAACIVAVRSCVSGWPAVA